MKKTWDEFLDGCVSSVLRRRRKGMEGGGVREKEGKKRNWDGIRGACLVLVKCLVRTMFLILDGS